MGKYDTNQKAGIEAGIYNVTVATFPQEKAVNGGFIKIDMEFSIPGQERNIKQSFFPNQLTSMFIALGFKEVEPGVYDGDIQAAYDVTFSAELYFEEYKRQDGTTGKARMLRNFKAVEQSSNPDGALTPEEVIWNE